ncbi:MAG: hypothetical protein LBQ82_02195 [Treponema sp.]|jgi:uncharacterized iron-regulated protein|nr:hypothetical protein [Treponema sp.]
MYNLDTGEKVDLDWFINALENEEIIIGGTNPTKEEFEEIDRKIASLKAMRQKKPITEAVLA